MNEFHKIEPEETKSISTNPEFPEPLVSPVKAAFVSLIGIFFLYQLLGAIITLLIFGMDFENADVNAMRLLTAGSQILFILLPALFLAKWIYIDVTPIIRYKIPKPGEVGLFLLGMIILVPLMQSYLFIQNYFIELLAEKSSFIYSIKSIVDELDSFVEETYGNLLVVNNGFEAVLVVFVVAVVPAVAEETFFRGFVQKSFEYKYKPIIAAIITALFFGIYHFNPYGFVALTCLGLYFGFSAYISKSIFIPVILHFANNFFSILAYLIIEDDEMLKNSAVPVDNIIPYFGGFLILLTIFILLVIGIKKYYTKANLTIEGG